uniref:CUE domain-containing protein n=1 Tax=Plectus sambesii TaxID=2011161 RepID=A0A914UUS7_9BILA
MLNVHTRAPSIQIRDRARWSAIGAIDRTLNIALLRSLLMLVRRTEVKRKRVSQCSSRRVAQSVAMAAAASPRFQPSANDTDRPAANDPDALDFNRAMQDFQRMFPTIDSAVIEDVLRSNSGGVDDTIDQLLLLAMDDGGGEDVHHETAPKRYDALPATMAVGQLRAASRSPSVSPRPDPFDHRSMRTPERPIQHIPAPNGVSRDLLDQRERSVVLEPPDHPSAHHELDQAQSRSYHPPLIGRLPVDFLRVGSPRRQSVDVADALDDIYAEIDRKNRRKRERQRSHTLADDGHKAYLGVFSTTSSTRHPNHRGTTALDGTGSQRRQRYNQETQQQAEILKEMMLENEWKRQLAEDPELIRYLEDQRIALLLQNREFMRDLRRNRDFMNTLERDSDFEQYAPQRSVKKVPPKKAYDDRTPVPDGPYVDPATAVRSESKSIWRRKSKSKRPIECAVPDGPQLDPIVSDLKIATEEHRNVQYDHRPIGDEPVCSGGNYGADSLPTIEPFPYTKQLPRGDEQDDEAFATRLKNMGKSSKQKFALMARKFTRRSKGARGMLGTSDAHYSGMNLLQSTDDRDQLVDADPSYGYNQFDNDDYNIGQRSDLNREGRLFGNR